MNYLEKVAEFHTTFNHPIQLVPAIPENRSQLRIDLIQEELNELTLAIRENNMVEVADALCDLQYVLSGAILEFGLKAHFDAMFENVHNSNMTKACKDLDEVKDTVDYYALRGVKADFQQINLNTYIVFRKIDNKVLKSVRYQKADIKQFLP